MKKISFTLTFAMALVSSFFGMSAHSESQLDTSELINIVRSKEGVISLNGPYCQELIEQDQALRAWRVTLGETPGNMSSPQEIPSENRCTLIIDDSVPSIVHFLQDFKTAFSGPNCWNTALRLSGLVQFARYSSPDEMAFWMNSPYCRELSESEQSLPGDIVEIRSVKPDQSQFFDEVHGMIYLSDDLVFSKNTSSRMSAYGIQRASLVYQTFRVDNPKCWKVQGRPNDCSKWANHYRCVGSEHDRISFEKENIDFAVLSSKVKKIESIFSEYVMYGHGDYEKNKAIIEGQLAEIENRILNNKNEFDQTAFFFQVLLLEVNSLKSQIGIISRQH